MTTGQTTRRTARPRSAIEAGFTLIELLVVISIIALLISILLPALKKAREAAMKIQGASQLQQQGIAFAAYANDHDGFIPAVTTPPDGATRVNASLDGHPWDSKLMKYLNNVKVFHCPIDTATRKFYKDRPQSYAINNELSPHASATSGAAMGNPAKYTTSDYRSPVGKRFASIHGSSGHILEIGDAGGEIYGVGERGNIGNFVGMDNAPHVSYASMHYVPFSTGGNNAIPKIYGHMNSTNALMIDGHVQSFKYGSIDGQFNYPSGVKLTSRQIWWIVQP